MIEKLFEPPIANSGTSLQLTVKRPWLRSKLTTPPADASRSSQRPAMRGRPFRNSGTLSLKSALVPPKVRLPLAFTNTSVKRWPQIENGKPIGSCTEPSSPTGSGSPGLKALKMTSVPAWTPPAAALTAV